ncbi:hypothetical protein KA977_05420 [Candidatus Dependentiae bacterium]|nr:hypothetical protein [Candidatus Dependentiae bacterium]
MNISIKRVFGDISKKNIKKNIKIMFLITNVDFEFSQSFWDEFQDDNGNWIPCIHNNHIRRFRGIDQKTQAIKETDTDIDEGSWQGPYSGL